MAELPADIVVALSDAHTAGAALHGPVGSSTATARTSETSQTFIVQDLNTS